jgi:tetratricopeptide (TPR) repeat protein
MGGCVESVAIPEVDTSGMEPVVKAAVEQARERIAEEPKQALAWGELGMVCHVHGLHPAAIAAYQRAAELAPDDVRWPYFLADVAALEGEVEAAADHYRKAMALRPTYAPISLALGDLLLAHGDLEGAERSYRRALALEEDLGPALLGLGQTLLERDAVGDAVTILERAAKALPNSGTARFSLSRAYQRAGRDDDAEQMAEAAANAEGVDFFSDPVKHEVIARGVSTSLLRDRARSLVSSGSHAQAIAIYERLIARDPDDADVHQELARSRQELGQHPAAISHLRRVLELAPDRTPVRIRLGILLLQTGLGPEALPLLEQARRELPDDAEVAALLGRTLLMVDQPGAALAALEDAARLGEVEPWMHNEWGNALARLGRLEEAEGHFRAVVAVEPTNAQALYQLGLAVELSGRRREALELYRRALAQAPNPLVRARMEALEASEESAEGTR